MSKGRSGFDTSKRTDTEPAQRGMDELFRALIENASDIITILDGEGTIRYQSPSVERVLGYKPHELIGSDMADLLHPDDWAKWLESFAALKAGLRSGAPEMSPITEGRLRHKDGSWHVLEGIAKVLETRSVKGMVINLRDITARRRAEEALRESEERFRSLVENAPVGIYRTTPDGRILMANPALVRMLRFDSFEELAARNLECGGYEPRYPRSIFRERIEREGRVIALESAWIRRDGSVVFVRESARAVRAADGRVLHYDGMVEDITTQRHAEEGLRRMSGRLLRLQDEERRRIARQLHETAAQGLAGLAVNLSIVKASAADLSPRARACLSESLELAEQCSRDIRTLSYLLHPPLVDEAGLAPALRWYTAGFARRSGIEVRVDVPPEFGRLPSDLELTLYRIVQEALTNIHRHSGSKTARICLQRRPKELVLTVADEGHGFPSAALEMAGPENADIGVGIPGMRERLRQLGGQLHIQSGSRGTTLTANVPLSETVHGETTHLTRGRS
jgi:PAS domain S-box-containing protein